MTSKNDAFWVVNISKKNVSLSDLALTIPAGRRLNLLDSKHFHYTLEQLEQSKTSGSLLKKNHLVKVVDHVPRPIEIIKHELSTEPRQVPKRSNVKIVETEYEELMISDEKFAQEFLMDEEKSK